MPRTEQAGGGGGHRRADSFRSGAHGERVRGNLSISPHVMGKRSQPRTNLQDNRSGRETAGAEAAGREHARCFEGPEGSWGNLKSANPPCPPLPPALEAKGRAAKGRERWCGPWEPRTRRTGPSVIPGGHSMRLQCEEPGLLRASGKLPQHLFWIAF